MPPKRTPDHEWPLLPGTAKEDHTPDDFLLATLLHLLAKQTGRHPTELFQSIIDDLQTRISLEIPTTPTGSEAPPEPR